MEVTSLLFSGSKSRLANQNIDKKGEIERDTMQDFFSRDGRSANL